MHLTLILPFPDVSEPLATYRLPLPLGGNLGWLVHQNWGRGHTCGKLLYTLGWVVGASFGVAGGTERKNDGSVRAQPCTNAFLNTSHSQNLSSPTASPLSCPTLLPKGIRCLSKLGNQSELHLQEFLTLTHRHLVGKHSPTHTSYQDLHVSLLLHKLFNMYDAHPQQLRHICSEETATT